MSKLTDLSGKFEGLRTEALELEKVEQPSEEQLARMDALPTEIDAAKAAYDTENTRVAKMDEIRSLSLDPANREGGFSAPNVIVKKDPYEGLDMLRNFSDDELVGRAVSALEENHRGSTDAQVQAATLRVENLRGVARYALLHGSPAYRSAFGTWMSAQASNRDPIYSAEENEAVRASMALGNSTGGYSLPTLLDPTLIHTGTAVKDPIRSIARIVEGTQNVWHGVSVGNVTAAWVAEGAASSDGSPTFAGPTVTAQKLTAYLTGSYEVFEDSDLQSQLPGLIAEAFSYKEQTAFISGVPGSNQPNGIVTAISATAASTVTCTTRGQFNSASAVDVFALVNAVPSRYEDSSTWVANKATFNSIRQMSTASQGSYFWTNFNNDVVGAPGQQPLLGSPVVQASDMASAQTSGTVIAILGDFSQFVIYDRIGTTVEFVQNVFNSSALPLGQRGLIAHKRVGSDITNVDAFRFLKT